jgi:exodeoxyribonuclease VII large subunit
MDYKSITEVNELVKSILESEPLLNDIYVKGEISNIKYHSRGHIYFSLKDENSKINAVFFNATGKLLFDPKDGDSVLIRGRINVYPVSGSYQIVVSEIKLDGIGNLYVLFEELKKKLASEGLFDKEHKKKIPRFPEKIGVITAKEGAAVRDIITTINRRYPLCEIYLFPSLVQGEGAKENIVKMIKKANETDMDVIILGRGGGSIEDLWAFNEEVVAREIYNSKIPIISAVGHEIDYTIADFVADLRAPTPTAAAELAVKNIEDIENYLSDAITRMNTALSNKVDYYEEKINKYKSNYIINNPMKLFESKENRLNIIKEKLVNISSIFDIKEKEIEYIKERMLSAYKNNILKSSNLLEKTKLKLDLINPNNILNKGYSIVKKDNKIIKSIKDIKIKDNINIVLSDGSILSEVKGKN